MYASIHRLTVVSRHTKPLSLFYSFLPITTRNNFTSPAHQTLHHLLEKCQSMKKLKLIHAQIILHGLQQQTLTISKLISFCAVSETGDLQYAHLMFDHLPQPNRHTYNSLIRGYVNSETPTKALHLYHQMTCVGISPNEFTYPFVLKVCAVLSRLLDGVLVHVQIIKLGFESNVYVQNGLISVYCGCGAIRDSRKVFDDMVDKSLVSWNTMVGGYSKMGYCREAFLLFRKMTELGVEPDDFTFVSLLSVCSQNCQEALGRLLHSYIVITRAHIDIYVQNAIVDMYAKCGHLHSAQTFFDRMNDKNVVSWTTMVSAYAKYGLVESARNLFYQMPVKNVVSWNSMISCYLQKGEYGEVLGLFNDIFHAGVTPDESTLTSVLSACCQLGDLEMGKNIHNYICSNYVIPSVTLFNSLIDMYAKCGLLETSLSIFSEMPEKNPVSWNVMIGALAFHGCGFEAVELFDRMQAAGIQPDKITFMGLLSACCHSGLTEIGKYYFDRMIGMYGVPHEIEHYACMIDLLGRVGLFGDAIKLIRGMPMKPDVVVWGALLGACRLHGKVEIGKQVLKHVLELEPYTSGVYVLVSNMFCEAGRWEDVKNIRRLMKDQGIKKSRGVSSVEVNGHVYEFMVDDQRNELSSNVYELLDQLLDHLKSFGHFSSSSDTFLNTEEV
ncbi:pentatricopeptide repeat-containing protein At2g22410, mitochondrial-like [Cynara cardunculus var. scolymus]|uniref:Pentatricopeptide repeat-containing protein n=1 Tax=Cynara cardunculus var. scolymus TaxID=59895 RepID=A0A103YH80_CYNCS|nr:pentatricopeptide repeat-containing protein At2g22410, mitochondrial-like [Cynara cardunculus var. scolymus]KVI09041.1 Pentatricopeptide repeat-containing protein [Cynara cardunculus var. scolymus]